MNDLYEETLFARWPDLYRGRFEPLTVNLMAFGCECNDGWYAVLDALSWVLTTHARALDRPPPIAVQVKEKYGALRYYAHGDDEFDAGAISMAEDLSARICEISGAPGRLCTRGDWYATFSPSVAAEKRFRMLDADEPLPPVPSEEIGRILRERWPTVIDGVVELPPGWLDIGDALASRLSHKGWYPERPATRILELREIDGLLAVRMDGGDARDRGAIAMAAAMADRTDASSGRSLLPPTPDEN
ncbi:hypothetical protein GCM10011611_02320 [Aliidongia dinghuensis]|uniref:Uncharacterized protein n=1 Tax=Aliidongia dinghuensis TaxID=1867774 RepID=A0A8J2YQC7_9PROT|nr:hypothetical protein [Aliidongia dinghuensis]GGF00247.1 hypothetical protein GCM10011611_02320 [Aliidongia dinghuensis]